MMTMMIISVQMNYGRRGLLNIAVVVMMVMVMMMMSKTATVVVD